MSINSSKTTKKMLYGIFNAEILKNNLLDGLSKVKPFYIALQKEANRNEGWDL
jgi:hypothetical protein